MKISNGTILEFILAVFFLSVGINMDRSIMSIITIVISISVMIHCLYSWIKNRKGKNKDNKNVLLIILSIIIIFLITYNIVLIQQSKKIKQQKNEYIKCVQKIKYNINTTVNSFEQEDYTYDYILSERKWKKLQKCAKKYGIKIETNK